jgi:hypothetical protein
MFLIRLPIIVFTTVLLSFIIFGPWLLMLRSHSTLAKEVLDQKALLGDSFGVLTALFSGISLILIIGTLWLQKEDIQQSRRDFDIQIKNTALSDNLSRMAELERTLGDFNSPDPFRFHGITDDDLQKVGLTAKEFGYLVSNFTISGIYYRITQPDNEEAFKKDSYRYNILYNLLASNRDAWKLIRKMLMPSHYLKKLDNTVLIIEAEQDRITALKP